MNGISANAWVRQRCWAGVLLSLLLCVGSVVGEVTYTVSEYPSYRKLYTPDAFAALTSAQRAWATTNATVECTSGALEPFTNATGVITYPTSPVTVGHDTHQLSACLYGYTFERIRPDYYLGDAVDAPDDVDWTATYLANSNLLSGIFYDASTPAIYFAVGGVYTLTWVNTDGISRTQTYQVSPVASARPYRIFWTSYPYNASPVDLAGKYVRLFGASSLLTVQEGMVTNTTPAGVTVTKQPISGVYVNTSTMKLYAAGQLTGQFLLAYYDSGTYERLLDVIVVEVCVPAVKNLTASVGDLLSPSGDGYGIEGLHVYQHNSADPADGLGPYLYQHQGAYSYSKKNGAVFSLRPTTSTTRALAEVYWAETDSQNVSWPFECDHYQCAWDSSTPLFVRSLSASNGGAALYVPKAYSVELMKYQSSDHARLNAEEKAVYSTSAGYALLKLQADDNVWFQPIRSVLDSDALYSHTTHVWPIGQEIRPPAALTNSVAQDVPAYLCAETSGRNYNPDIYIAPSAQPDENLPTSALYFVNTATPATPLEAWWYTCVQQADMPESLQIPSYPAWYTATWPDLVVTPQIVLASQRGGLGDSLLVDDETGATNAIPNGAILADETPVIYAQNDVSAVGYNPNEEHAIVLSGGGGYVPWAIRCDLNTDASSRPAVLTQYVIDNQYAMSLHYVLLTNERYNSLAADTTAGTVLPGPHPLDLLTDPWQTETYWDTPGPANPAFRDRKGVIWARCAGEIGIRMYYPMQSGFWFPSLTRAQQPTLGTAIPWLARVANATADVLTGAPAQWNWNVMWPANVPDMQIGQTLTTTTFGLPEVWNAKSVGVVYPDPADLNRTALLYDPTVVQTSGFNAGVSPISDFGFETGDNGNVLVRSGLYYFRDLPPSISDRFFFNPSADVSACLCLKGKLEERATGVDLLHPNVLNASERQALKDVVASDHAKKAMWDIAISALATEPVLPSPAVFKPNGELGVGYRAADHYALTAMGQTNYVVLIENDATNALTGVKVGDVVSMHVLKVLPELYAGAVVTREDPNNLLSQQIDILYTEAFAGQADDFIFEWKKAAPNASGTIPSNYENGYSGYGVPEAGRTRFTLGGQGSTLADLVNTYYVMRYQAKPGTAAFAAVGETWSAWCGPALAEGWVQRVLNSITPFSQRMQDLYVNGAETAVSMLAQIGGPYQGDVALNQDNLTSVGLIQLYETVLNKAESLSLSLGVNNGDANKQLLLAAERLADLYMVLGNEAYTDALNPTISFGSDFALGGINYGALSSSLFCFQNQEYSLLDEELALLRGRSLTSAPDNTVSPCFNRLLWNMTSGITGGEVAYTINYGISEKTNDAVLDENDAARLYPQGHGDAWGHYLSALKGYYRLLRNPNFSWGEISMSELNLGDTAVNVDYDDEARFAQVAAALAKTGAEIVDRTARKVWADGGTVGSGYLDSVSTRAAGYGEWGTRSGLGAFYNWAVANSILPPETVSTNGIDGTLNDEGLLATSRGSVCELASLATDHAAIQSQVDRLDRGLNPLGFADNAVPFDISVDGVSDGSSSHFEQILARAEVALQNADTILDRAQTQANALRQLQDVETSYGNTLANQEQSYTDQLVALFGTPYAGDMGPSGTYVSGYAGPDLYHYMWMDLTPYGFSSLDLATTLTNTLYVAQEMAYDTANSLNFVTTETETVAALHYALSANGLVVKPSSITGTRRASGKIQAAYRDYLQAYVAVQNCQNASSRAYDTMAEAVDLAACDANQNRWKAVKTRMESIRYFTNVSYGLNLVSTLAEGVAEVLDSRGDGWFFTVIAKAIARGVQYSFKVAADSVDYAKEIEALDLEKDAALVEYGDAISELAAAAGDAIDAHAKTVYALNTAWATMLASLDTIDTVVAEGERLLEAREQTRTQAVAYLTKARYNDMFFRLTQNEALARYSTAFDLAQQYTWLTAKAYDYETGRLTADAAAGSEFLAEIVAARSPGALSNGKPMLGGYDGDSGLSDILARMKINWGVLKPRLGINNPQAYTTWFSLRQGLFRILPSTEGDAAWSLQLSKYWVDNILELPDFKRSCQSFSPAQPKEPGLVIPFSTRIEAGKNLFGNELAGGDSAYDSTYFATKIASAGIRFVGYNTLASGASGTASLSATPVVYLMPLGTDRMRDPGNLSTVLDYPVADQVMQEPFVIGSDSLASSDWTSLYNNLRGVTDGAVTIRRYPSFRASTSESDGDDIKAASKRLIGRSVWNTRWALIIPAASLGTDREAALTAFIKGRDTNRDGKLEQMPVCDIEIGFKTYSSSGN